MYNRVHNMCNMHHDKGVTLTTQIRLYAFICLVPGAQAAAQMTKSALFIIARLCLWACEIRPQLPRARNLSAVASRTWEQCY